MQRVPTINVVLVTTMAAVIPQMIPFRWLAPTALQLQPLKVQKLVQVLFILSINIFREHQQAQSMSKSQPIIHIFTKRHVQK